jgi:ABC-type transporter Mla subunit MlaD
MDKTLPLALARLMKERVEVEVTGERISPTPQQAITSSLAPQLKSVAERLEQTLVQAEESLKQGDFARFGKLLQQARELATRLREQIERTAE